eukprot:366268-Chlamydomonas_euryale.AAC.7
MRCMYFSHVTDACAKRTVWAAAAKHALPAMTPPLTSMHDTMDTVWHMNVLNEALTRRRCQSASGAP